MRAGRVFAYIMLTLLIVALLSDLSYASTNTKKDGPVTALAKVGFGSKGSIRKEEVVSLSGLPTDRTVKVTLSILYYLEAKPVTYVEVGVVEQEWKDSLTHNGIGPPKQKSGSRSWSRTNPGSSVSFTIYAYASKSWKGGEGTAKITATLRAEWPDVVTVTAGEGGSVSPSGRLEVWGDYLSVRATPDPGYEFDHWEVSGGISIVDSSANGRFRVAGDGTIKAVFRKPPPPCPVEYKLTITVSPSGAGTTNPGPGTYRYCAGTSVTVSASAYGGYVFDHWELDGANAGSSASITVTMNRDHSLVAVFKSSSGDGGDGGNGQQPPSGNETYTYYIDHYKRVVEKERSYYVSNWDATTIYWPLSGEKIEGKLAPSEYFGVRVRVSVGHKDRVLRSYLVFLYTETRTTSDPSLDGKRFKKIDYTETKLVRMSLASYDIEVTVPSTWAWYLDLSTGRPVPVDETRTMSVSDSRKNDGTYEYDLGRWVVKRDVVQVGGYGDFPYTVSLNGQAKEFRARVSAVKAEMEACYYDWGVNATVFFLWCDDGSPVLGRRYLSAALEYGDFRKVSTVSMGDGLAFMEISYLEMQLDAIEATMTLTPLIERGEPVPQSPATEVKYQDIALVVYENSETKLRVKVIRWGTMEPLPNAIVIAWVEGTDRRVEAVTCCDGFATVDKIALLQGLSEYELWAMAYPCSTYNELLNPLRYAKILVDKQPP